ncbi:MAG: c-type cytochrome [Planctomycetota bacterium]
MARKGSSRLRRLGSRFAIHCPMILAFTLCMWSFLAISANASDEDDEEEVTYLPGLVAEFSQGTRSFSRVDQDLRFDWGIESPDVGLSQGPFSVRWTGLLFVQKGGKYRLSADLGGRMQLRIGGDVDWKAEGNGGVVVSETTDLDFGYHPFTVQLESSKTGTRLLLAWQSDQFDAEPIPATAFVHESKDLRGSQHRLGESLVRAHRCANCHAFPSSLDGPKSPSLAKIRGAVHPGWLAPYLEHPSRGKEGVAMPEFGLSEDDAKAVASFLWARSERWDAKGTKKGDAAKGAQLANAVGCLACHKIGEVGKNPRFGGGDLSRIAEKRPEATPRNWLTAPQASNPDHRGVDPAA